ncbi:MAG: branched-chain amino acid transport system permease protein [Chloroflexota bacterium]|nr:branched-chain amino acid transport system permease protein [Chloroflexota bacterium]
MMTTLYAALFAGALYTTVAIGFNIVFISSGTFNFAQAQYAMLGLWSAWIGLEVFHWNLALVILLGLVVGAAIGFLNERMAIRFLPSKGVHGELVTTVGFSVLITGLAVAAFGNNPQTVHSVLSGNEAITLLGGRVYPYELVMLVVALLIVGGAELLSRHTLLGLAALATAEDRVASILKGINVRRLQLGAYMLAGGLLMAVGPFIAPVTYATTGIGDGLNIKAFVAMSIGGFGSPKGALIGGMSAGLVEALVGRYLNSNFQNLALLILLLAVLMLRPYGLFGERVERAV